MVALSRSATCHFSPRRKPPAAWVWKVATRSICAA